MVPTQVLSVWELQRMDDRLRNATARDIGRVYGELLGKGYPYAGKAAGAWSVAGADESSVADCLHGDLLQALAAQACRHLPEPTLRSIRLGMARRYVETLRGRCDRQGGRVSQDIDYPEALAMHRRVLDAHRLPIGLWVLHAPMELTRRARGDAAAEALWQDLLDPAGDELDALAATLRLCAIVHAFRDADRPALRELARDWMARLAVTGGPPHEGGRAWQVLQDWLDQSACGRRLRAFVSASPPEDPCEPAEAVGPAPWPRPAPDPGT